MPAGRLIIEQDISTEQALRRGVGLWSQLSLEQPVALYACTLTEEALVLGRYQRGAQALSDATLQSAQVLRRSSGGACVRAGQGISYLALALRERSALIACPAQRLLNRNVRGVLQGLRLTGVQANYFGRDFLSFAARPAVYVGWDAAEDGKVLLEFFVSDRQSCWPDPQRLAYPPRSEDPFRGQPVTTLQEAGARSSGMAVLEKLAEGFSKNFGVEWQRSEPDSGTLPLTAADDPSDQRFSWSAPREEAIGFVSAGVSLDSARRVAAVRLAGDFFAHRACATTLERVLLGVTPTTEMIGRAVDAAYAHTGHDFEGVRSLKTLQEAILDAAAAAASDLSD
jgi:hypothetical protein